MLNHLGNKMHAPQARISKPNWEDDAERNPVSGSADPHPHEGLKLTIIGCEALDPQQNVEQKDDDERSIKHIPHLSGAERKRTSLCSGERTNVSKVYYIGGRCKFRRFLILRNDDTYCPIHVLARLCTPPKQKQPRRL